MNAIKDLLESVSETQKRIAKAQEARAKSEERKASALEVIANHFIDMMDQARSPQKGAPARETQPAKEELAAPSSQASTSQDVDRETGNVQAKKLTAAAKKEVFDIVNKMRGDGNSWEKIARNIASRGYPTISGKGSWRGVMAKNLYEKLASG